MKKLKLKMQHKVIAGESTLAAWDYDERLFKKINILSGEILKKNGITPAPVEVSHIKWSHISGALVVGMTPHERERIKLAASALKPTFKVKELSILKGTKIDYLTVELDVPTNFLKFFDFVVWLCGKERVKFYGEHKPHVSIWGIQRADSAKVQELIPEITTKVKRYLQPFTPSKLSFWDDFEISEIETLGFVQKVQAKYQIAGLR